MKTTATLVIIGGFVAGGACTVQSAPPTQPAYPQQPPAVVEAPPPAAPPPVQQPAPPPPVVAEPAPPPASPAGPDINGPCADAATDFANEFDGAVPLAATSATVVCSSRGDKDVFAVTIPAAPGGTIVRYEMRGQSKLAPKLMVFDSNRKQVHHHAGSRNEHIQGWFFAEGGSQVYVRAMQIHGDQENYLLSLTATALGDATEPNDNLEQATPLQDGKGEGVMAWAINNKDAGSDWYSFDVAKAGPITITVDMPEDSAARINLFNANRKPMGSKVGSRAERVVWEVKKLTPGKHLVEIKSPHTVKVADKGEVPSRLSRRYSITITQ